MKEMYNCPNCGAPIGYSPKCEYCGTVLQWIPTTIIEIENPEIVTLQSRASVQNEILYDHGLKRLYVEERMQSYLSASMAPELIKHMEFRLDDDFETNETVMTARLRVVGPRRRGEP